MRVKSIQQLEVNVTGRLQLMTKKEKSQTKQLASVCVCVRVWVARTFMYFATSAY